jgi:hypothetical protein
MISLVPVIQADAADNPNLFVSAENSRFENHFSGSMVIEVVVRDNDIRDTDQGKGEPDVTINGKSLRMVQATDGNWYAYFANVDKAKSADSTVGLPGKGLDFGTFCNRTTPSSVFGISLSDTDGFFVPRSDCDGNPLGSDLNNVVRHPRSLNTNSPLSGQIGLDPIAWPLVQLFSFRDVTIQYNAAGGAQRVDLQYDDIPNISTTVDRDLYPQNAEVFLTINDFQLNQDPTDEDSWTFSVGPSVATFYQAFDSSGQESAADTSGLVNLVPRLSSLGFKANGEFSMSLGSVIELKSNSNQPVTSIGDGTSTYTQIVTLVEHGPNSGIFESSDSSDRSTIGISKNAPRGEAGTIRYNRDSTSILTGSSTASVSLQKAELKIDTNSKSLLPGTKYSLALVDPDQNINANSRDSLNVFRDSTLIPTLNIGNPVTLAKSSNVMVYPNPNNFGGGEKVQSAILDKNSQRLFIDTTANSLTGTNFTQVSLNLGFTASDLKSMLINPDSDSVGTNWINYDFRSLENDFGINDFSDTKIDLYFGSMPSSPCSSPSFCTIVNPGDISSSKGLIQLDSNIVRDIFKENGSIFLVINFGSSPMTIQNESDLQPIVLDFFSFGLDSNLNGIDNSIYRFELEETSDNSSTFKGTFEYAIANQLNILDANFISTLHTIGDDIKFFITDRLIDESGLFISYSDLDKVGISTTVSTQSDVTAYSGTVSTDSNSYRFGQPVTIILNDPDLNTKSDRIDIYHVIDDPSSPNVDTIGSNGVKMLEILIKDTRYKRCTVDGVEYGGLASTGFSLIETGPSTGVFEGVFKMPSKICNKNGTQLISPAGGSIEIKYYDSRDALGQSNIFSSINSKQSTSDSIASYPQLSASEITLPSSGSTKEIVLSGSISNQKRGMPLSITLVHPNGQTQQFSASVTNSGNYRTIFSINSNSLSGVYTVNLEYAGQHIGSASFNVVGKNIPSWIKDNAKQWSSSTIGDSEFMDTLEYLIEKNIIPISPSERSLPADRYIPSWIKDNAKWWSSNTISDEDFIKSIQYLVKKGIIRV